MPKIAYRGLDIGAKRLKVIAQANDIIEEYQGQGFTLTLRQLYYQFVSRGLIANKLQEYKRLGDIVNDGRLAGLIDWEAITDRTRHLESVAHWDSPADIIESAARQYRIDRWETQHHHVEVWIEKDALAGVIEPICRSLDVSYLSCRGYTSQSEMWTAAQRLLKHEGQGKHCVILHLGDHDPSGIDMSRDIDERLRMFGATVELHRIALNMDQVDRYEPPPNPAKTTDSRYAGYITEHGDESWELDALDPRVIANLIQAWVSKFRDEGTWAALTKREKLQRELLDQVSDHWEEVKEYLETKDDEPDPDDEDA